MSRRQAVWCAFACAALVRMLYLIVARPQFQSSTATVRDRRGWRAAGRSWARCHRGCGTTSAARPVDLHVVVHADSDLRGRKYLAAPWRRSARCPLWCVALTFVAVDAIFFSATRYRAPMEFALLFYAGIAIDHLVALAGRGTVVSTPLLVSCLRSSFAFGRRCIPAPTPPRRKTRGGDPGTGCPAPPLNIPGIFGRRALGAGRLAALGATTTSETRH